MRRLLIGIDTSNAAFEEPGGEPAELARILRAYADHLEGGGHPSVPLRDHNGNTTGRAYHLSQDAVEGEGVGEATPGPWITDTGAVRGPDGQCIARMDREEEATRPVERDANARLVSLAVGFVRGDFP